MQLSKKPQTEKHTCLVREGFMRASGLHVLSVERFKGVSCALDSYRNLSPTIPGCGLPGRRSYLACARANRKP